jgi:predicted acylesterase/phospholipase RssA
MDQPTSSHFALILPGAVARGAYEAGVIQVLTEKEINIDRIVATSSGALNGLAYAVGIRNGHEKEMAKLLTASWIENGGWSQTLNFNIWGLLRGRGLSSAAGLLKMMRDMIKPCKNSKKKDVELWIILTPLDGTISKISDRPATTYEKIVKFSGSQFDTPEGLEEVFNVVSAACAFPGLFDPVEVKDLGLCVDGGVVNNAPIKYALLDSTIHRVLIPVPFPALMPSGGWKSGVGLLSHLIEILINERLFRDLKNAQNVNHEADKLQQMVSEQVITTEQMEKIKSVLKIRKVEITEVRPDQGLKSSAFSGFFRKGDRIRLVEQGRKAALETLARIPAHNPTGEQTT